MLRAALQQTSALDDSGLTFMIYRQEVCRLTMSIGPEDLGYQCVSIKWAGTQQHWPLI